MAVIRARQPAITRITPHQGNKHVLIPNRRPGGTGWFSSGPGVGVDNWQLEENTDNWQLEESTDVWLLE